MEFLFDEFHDYIAIIKIVKEKWRGLKYTIRRRRPHFWFGGVFNYFDEGVDGHDHEDESRLLLELSAELRLELSVKREIKR